jgi:hypothetical protein
MVCRAMDSEVMITAFRQAPRTAVLLSLAAAAALGACGGTVALESSSGTTGSPGTSGTNRFLFFLVMTSATCCFERSEEQFV